MSIAIDHLGTPAADPGASARFLGEIDPGGHLFELVARPDPES